MVTTIDVVEAIRQCIFDNWQLHGSLSRDTMGKDAFNTGIPAPSRKYPSIEIVPVDEDHKVLTAEWWKMLTLVHIHIWERPKTNQQNALATAKNNRRYLEQEVKRILHLKQTTIKDIEWIYPEMAMNIDMYHAVDEDTYRKDSSRDVSRGTFYPILHTILPVRALQFHHATMGAIAVNR